MANSLRMANNKVIYIIYFLYVDKPKGQCYNCNNIVTFKTNKNKNMEANFL